MQIFAQISAGSVVNIAVANVSTDLDQTKTWVRIDNLLPVPGIGWAYSGGNFISPAAPVLTLAQQAATALAAGYTLTLSGTFTLAATLFPTDAATQAKLDAVVTTVNATGKFPGGATSYPMKDSAGQWHTFTVAQYVAVAGAIAAHVAALDLIVDGNPLNATSLPASSATLTV